MLTLLLLALAGQVLPAADDTPDTPPAVITTASALTTTTWTGLKHALSTIPIPAHDDHTDERGLR